MASTCIHVVAAAILLSFCMSAVSPAVTNLVHPSLSVSLAWFFFFLGDYPVCKSVLFFCGGNLLDSGGPGVICVISQGMFPVPWCVCVCARLIG